MFDLKTQPWHIHVSTREESKAAQEWLFSQGITWCNGDIEPDAFGSPILSNYYATEPDEEVKVNDRGFMHGSYRSEYQIEKYELKLSFITKVSAEPLSYPVVETEQQKQVRELEETIRQATLQIQKLKEGM